MASRHVVGLFWHPSAPIPVPGPPRPPAAAGTRYNAAMTTTTRDPLLDPDAQDSAGTGSLAAADLARITAALAAARTPATRHLYAPTTVAVAGWVAGWVAGRTAKTAATRSSRRTMSSSPSGTGPSRSCVDRNSLIVVSSCCGVPEVDPTKSGRTADVSVAIGHRRLREPLHGRRAADHAEELAGGQQDVVVRIPGHDRDQVVHRLGVGETWPNLEQSAVADPLWIASHHIEEGNTSTFAETCQRARRGLESVNVRASPARSIEEYVHKSGHIPLLGEPLDLRPPPEGHHPHHLPSPGHRPDPHCPPPEPGVV